MENLGGEVVYPTAQQVCEVNRRMIETFGGFFVPPDNLNNPDALSYVLEVIAFPVYGQVLYPSMKEKAAALAHHIITRHAFHDGNKRTAVHMAWEFLLSNSTQVFLDATIVELTEAIARSDATYEDFFQWLHSHQGSGLPG